MSADTIYTSSQAAKLAGISGGSLRNYCQGGRFGRFYEPFLSAGAAPAPGQPRQFTAADIAVLRYIRSRTAQGASHEAIAGELAAGALESYDWHPPEESAAEARAARQAAEPPAEEPAANVALALASQWANLLEAARAREAELTDRLIAAEARAARAEGELAALRAAADRPRPGLFRRLFGG